MMFISGESEIKSTSFGASSVAASVIDPESNYTFSLDFFSGPLDLLLHLVRQQEVAIEEVQMSLIAEQYLQIISKSSLIDLDKASEYLVIAATLMSIKSQSVLSKNSIEDEEDNYEDSSFLEELRERLKAYELTKARASSLRSTPQLGLDTFVRADRQAFDFSDEETLAPEEPQTLATAFMGLLKRVGEASKSFLIRIEPISIVSFMMKVIDVVKVDGEGKGSFLSMVKAFVANTVTSKRQDDQKTHYGARGVIIGSFIAILELAKRGVVNAVQESYDSDILVQFRLTDGAENPVVLGSEFDGMPEDDSAPLASKIVKIADYRNEEESEGSQPEDVEVLEDRKEVNCG